ncbi:hypothetical protein [Stenotrophomonas sp. CFBP 13718]|uniref:hypothetical protein n=1 Tax=Stenotrophomonas sp. CFBP 13718 TaxID=2775304 RepID=UPI001786181C|nr:hypothetical protein [Stenotrophomonas sp. CFBP 13718]MBD8697040.1 hypothetical protein [Stenotrophomonas sp. CFBP 13718]
MLRQFTTHLESVGISLDILERPEPPEAIVKLNGEVTWIEITDAFLDQDHAISLTSAAADDMAHISDDGRLVCDPDAMFSSVLHSVISAKYEKASMRSIANDLGPGILLVGVFTPFTTAEVVSHEESGAIAELVSSNSIAVFKAIYVYDGTGKRSFHALFPR